MNRPILLCALVGALAAPACKSDEASSSPAAEGAATAKPERADGETEAPAAKVPGALTVAEADAAVQKDPERYDGKPMKVQGVVQKLGSHTAVKAVTYSVNVTPSVDEKRPVVHCGVGKEEPTVEVGASVVAEGTVRLNKMRGADGATVYRIELRDCKVQ